ncbi:MAG: NTP transferase domain-containing protein [Bacteroidales bacterium]|nr:NTP transferase domain-containing protein [Bacteroidales bacterium]
MNYAILAAGKGSRLVEDGILLPKPLVPVCGETLLSRLLSIFVRMKAQNICVIINKEMKEVEQYLKNWQISNPDVRLQICIQSTESSMHSFASLSELLPEGRFVLTTVDTVFQEKEFCDYIEAFSQCEFDGLFAVTRYVDDEKPLWISTNSEQRIIEFSDSYGTFVSGGIYGLDTRTAFPVLRECLASGKSRMRNYQRALLSAGLHIKAFEFSKIFDIDHKNDIEKASHFLR